MRVPKFFLFSNCLFMAIFIVGCGGKFEANIGGTLSGLAGGTSVTLLNNGSDKLTLTTNGGFTFAGQIAAGSSYNVTVSTNPIGETCTVSNGTGTISETSGSNVTNITVQCDANTSSYNYVHAEVTGLNSGNSITLQDNGTDSYTTSSNGSFVFPTALTTGASYSVTVSKQPTNQTCTIANATGTISSSASNTPVIISCK